MPISIDYELVEDANPKVKLSLDMKEYLEGVKKYNSSLLNAKEYESIRQNYVNLVWGVGAHDIWPNILLSLKASPQRKILDTPAVYADIDSCSLATYAMIDNCHELVKNSMDALIDQYLADPDATPTTLEMTFTLEINPPNVTLKIQDNGPGFPESVIDTYNNKFSKEKGWDSFKTSVDNSSSNKDQNIYFGGQGKGLAMLLAMIKYGKIPGYKGVVTTFTDIGDNTRLSLSTSQGALIEITTPIARPEPYLAVSVIPAGTIVSENSVQTQPQKETTLLNPFDLTAFRKSRSNRKESTLTSSSTLSPTSSSTLSPTSSSTPSPTSPITLSPTSSSTPSPTSQSIPSPTTSRPPSPTSTSTPNPSSSSTQPTNPLIGYKKLLDEIKASGQSSDTEANDEPGTPSPRR